MKIIFSLVVLPFGLIFQFRMRFKWTNILLASIRYSLIVFIIVQSIILLIVLGFIIKERLVEDNPSDRFNRISLLGGFLAVAYSIMGLIGLYIQSLILIWTFAIGQFTFTVFRIIDVEQLSTIIINLWSYGQPIIRLVWLVPMVLIFIHIYSIMTVKTPHKRHHSLRSNSRTRSTSSSRLYTRQSPFNPYYIQASSRPLPQYSLYSKQAKFVPEKSPPLLAVLPAANLNQNNNAVINPSAPPSMQFLDRNPQMSFATASPLSAPEQPKSIIKSPTEPKKNNIKEL